ncbi:ROK family protein [Herbidospora sp. NEAU-GS84]|uniref:ROK family protein n=1 Tax=Herbidospora solisilvae TaxID=2696284 RepID=A0A7C9N7D4_9ACTN|nr:ROK family protein [Herbidospora solisilvae]NAS23013.1 ROK family protein [Herbidospora solisilvae]
MARPERKTVRDVRKGNRGMLLRTLYFGGPRSRHELTGLTGLSAATISTMTGDLLTEKILMEAGQVDSDGGRPRVLLRVNPVYAYLIGVDVAETHVRVELFDLEMTEKARVDYTLRPSHHDIELVARRILAGIDVVLADGQVTAAQVLGVGIGVPGIVERGASDALIHAKTFGWDGVPLGALMRAGTSLPVFIDNGAKTMGQAELWFGAGRGADHAVIVLIGSGVGATVVADGQAVRGTSNSAGEWGHTKIEMNGRPCRCGSRGCLEAYIGAEGLLARAGVPAQTTDWPSALGRVLADGGPVVDETLTYLGTGLANLINMLNPERILIGGWAGLMIGERHLDQIRVVVGENSLTQPYNATSIVLGELGPDAVAMGAATLVLEEFLDASAPLRLHVAS